MFLFSIAFRRIYAFESSMVKFWDKVFGKMTTLKLTIENTNPSIDDLDFRFVSDRVEYWETNDRILNKNEMLKVIVPKEIPAGSHNLRVVVIDGVGNTAIEEYTITL